MRHSDTTRSLLALLLLATMVGLEGCSRSLGKRKKSTEATLTLDVDVPSQEEADQAAREAIDDSEFDQELARLRRELGEDG